MSRIIQNSATDPASDLYADLVHLVDSISEGIIFLDRQWRITYANEAARRISRIEPEYLNGPTHWELYPETLGTTCETIYRRSMEERVPLSFEYFHQPFGNWLSLNTLPIPTGIAVHYRNISHQKQVEANRDESAFRLQQLFDTTTDAVAMLDRDYNFTFLNRRAIQLLSPSGDVLGTNLWKSFPGTVYEDSPYVFHYKRAMNEGISGNFEAYYPEPLNIWLAVESRPADHGIVVFFRDITAQRSAAAELLRKTEEAERQAAEIEAVYRTAPIGLALFDPIDFRYLRLNNRQAAFFGLKPEEVVGRRLTEMAPIPGLNELFQQVLTGKPVINYPLEGELIGNPGVHRYWTVNYSPVFATDGSVQAISAASLEVTPQKKAEKALIQSEKLAAVGRLASSISHEINNPLEAVTNLLYLIGSHEQLPEQIKSFVDLAESEIARVSQIATQTLRFYRQAARPTPVTAAQLTEPVLDLYRNRFRNNNVKVQTHFVTTAQIYCLENEIRQVLSNLIANAIDAMRSGGTLFVRAHQATDHTTGAPGIRIAIADNGHGMDKVTRGRVFEPFFTTKDLNGTGLGLWVSHDIVNRHNGRISIRSSQYPDHHGTVFSLFLPIQPASSLEPV
jgi:PAS domain S-box-containing protein